MPFFGRPHTGKKNKLVFSTTFKPYNMKTSFFSVLVITFKEY